MTNNSQYNIAWIDAAKEGDVTKISYIWNLSSAKISEDAISDAFRHSGQRGHLKAVTKIWELASEKISDHAIYHAFSQSAAMGYFDTTSQVWNLASNGISDAQISRLLRVFIERDLQRHYLYGI